jgi:hypothetical protein
MLRRGSGKLETESGDECCHVSGTYSYFNFSRRALQGHRSVEQLEREEVIAGKTIGHLGNHHMAVQIWSRLTSPGPFPNPLRFTNARRSGWNLLMQ